MIVTLGVVAILLVVAMQIANLTGNAAIQTIAKNEQVAVEEMAMSGIHLAMLILAQDAAANDTDSLQEIWADPDKIQQAVKDLGFEFGTLELVISDELGKIQLNALLKRFPGNEMNMDQQVLFERFLHLAAAKEKPDHAGEPVEILNAVKDWLDSNDDDAVTGLSGAESNYYQSLDPPRRCANGPFDHVEELLNVKGIVKGALTDKDNSPLDFGKVFTVYGLGGEKKEQGRYGYPGKININTAPLPVIAALLPEGREHQAKDLAEFRVEKPEQDQNYTHILEKGWCEKVIEFSEKEKTAFDRKIRYSSDIFRAACFAGKNSVQVHLWAVIKREQQKESKKWICRILQLEKV